MLALLVVGSVGWFIQCCDVVKWCFSLGWGTSHSHVLHRVGCSVLGSCGVVSGPLASTRQTCWLHCLGILLLWGGVSATRRFYIGLVASSWDPVGWWKGHSHRACWRYYECFVLKCLKHFLGAVTVTCFLARHRHRHHHRHRNPSLFQA